MAKKKKKEGGKGKKSGGDDDGAPEIEVPKKGFSDFVGNSDAKYGPPGWAHRMSTFETFVGEYHDAGATSATDATATGKINAKIVRVVSNRDAAYGVKRAISANIPTMVVPRGYCCNILGMVSI